jgi:hypothetical protein
VGGAALARLRRGAGVRGAGRDRDDRDEHRPDGRRRRGRGRAHDHAIDVGRNVCHGSDRVENAKKEIALWFKEGEVQSWKSAQHDWVYEK